jgi:CHAT domain-containing protein
LGGVSPADAYTELLPLKGLVSARQQELRLIQQQAAREPDSPAAQAYAQLLEQTQLLSNLSQMTPEPQQAAVHRQRMQDVHAQLESIQQQLSKVSESYRTAKSQRARTPAELAAALPARSALVDVIVFGQYQMPDAEHREVRWEEQITAFIIRPDQPVAWVFLGTAESMERAIADWRQSYGLGAGAVAGSQLRQQLWDPLEPYLKGVDSVLVSPDGPLCGLPWGALPGKSSVTYLIEDYAFAVVPIPQVLPKLLGPPPQSAPPTLLLVGDIDYGAEPGRLPAGTSTRSAVGRERDGRRLTFAPLKAGPREIASIHNTFRARFPESSAKAKVLGNTEATEAEFRKLSSGYRWLHVVTHGYFAEDLSSANPALVTPADFQTLAERPVRIEELAPDLLSGLALTGANQPPREDSDDGILTALEVSALDLHQTEMVVLSACETGLGRAAGGEGLLGLQRAFQLAGTQTVVASLWQVDDKATEVLMRDFYERLWKQKLPKLEALRQAQLAMLRDGVKRMHAMDGGARGLALNSEQPAGTDGRLPPYYWAAFVLSGNWR